MKVPKSLIESFISSEFSYKTTSTGEYIIRSPFNLDTKGKLYINKENGNWIDFKGSEDDSGSFLKFVRMYIGLRNNAEAFNYLIQNYSLGDSSFEEPVVIEKPKTSEVINNFINKDKPTFFDDVENLGIFGRKAYKYIVDRKIEKEYIKDIGYVFNDDSRYNRRVIIPFFENGQMVYFISRSIDPKETLRYLNVEKLDSKEFVFNIDNINEDEELIICEGVFDAMSITTDQTATCLLSADIGLKQMEKIFSKKPKTIIYVPDKDKTGLLKMEKNINKLITYCPYSGLEIKIFDVPEGCKDLNDMKIKTGKNYILKKECRNYKKNSTANLFTKWS